MSQLYNIKVLLNVVISHNDTVTQKDKTFCERPSLIQL